MLELYCFAKSIQSFLTNTFPRMWMTWDRLSQVNEMIRDDGIKKIMAPIALGQVLGFRRLGFLGRGKGRD